MILVAFTGAVLFAGTTASAGGPATTDHVIDMPFFDPGGINCATGNVSDLTGVASGVIHTVATPKGGFRISGNVHGTSTNDDVPTDGQADAINTFVSHFNDLFFASGKEMHTFGLHGSGRGLPDGPSYRFDVVLHLVLDPQGNPTVNITKVVCR